MFRKKIMKNITLFSILAVSLLSLHSNASQPSDETKLQALLNHYKVGCPDKLCHWKCPNYPVVVSIFPTYMEVIIKDLSWGRYAHPDNQVDASDLGQDTATAHTLASHAAQQARSLNLIRPNTISIWGTTTKSALLLEVQDNVPCPTNPKPRFGLTSIENPEKLKFAKLK